MTALLPASEGRGTRPSWGCGGKALTFFGPLLAVPYLAKTPNAQKASKRKTTQTKEKNETAQIFIQHRHIS